MENFLQSAQEWISVYWIKIVGALLILLIGRITVSIIISMIKKVMVKSKTDETLIGFFSSLIRVALMTFIIIAALGSLGVQTTSLVAIIGAAGLAVGFALQSSLSNFASGVMIIMFRPFKSGDFVEAGGTTGSVEEIGIFSTFLKTLDNKAVIVPNSTITGSTITNYSAKDTRRVDMVFGIGYDDDLKLAKNTLWEIVNADDRILKDPAPTVAVSELGDSSVNFVCRPWVNSADYWNVFFDTTEKVKLIFDEKGISIPYPQTDVHLFKEDK